MKHRLGWCLLLVPAALAAEPVGRQDAQATARDFLAAKGLEMRVESMPYRAPRKGASAGSAAYYVFNAADGQGYVIVSGDDRTEPVLGYVEQGSFHADSIPENMRSWLQQYADEIQSLDGSWPAVTEEAASRVRARRMQKARHSVPVLLSTKWNQGNPYNLNCPEYYRADGSMSEHAVTGCVATAFAQVMAFHRYPSATANTIPALTNTYKLDDGSSKTLTRSAIIRGTKIDWDNILNQYKGDETDEQKQAVATLMRLCGQTVSMHYAGSSAATTDLCRMAAVKYFGYDESCEWLLRSWVTTDEWVDRLYEELAAGYPLLTSGHTTSGGHAFVLDGYDAETGLFHVNWGWGGGSDGWFVVSSLNPGDNSGIGSSSGSDGYSMGNGVLMHLRLPDSETDDDQGGMTVYGSVTCTGTGVRLSYWNLTGVANSFDTGLAVFDDTDGSVSLIEGTSSTLTVGKNGYVTLTKDLNGKLSEGVYKVVPASKTTSNKVWHSMLPGRRKYIRATVNASGVPSLDYVTPNVDFTVDTIVFAGNRVVNTNQEVQVTFRNRGDDIYHTVSLYIDHDGTSEKACNTALNLAVGGTATVSFYCKPTEVGAWTVRVCSTDGLTEYGSAVMEVFSKAEAAQDYNLTVSSVKMTNCADKSATSSIPVLGNLLTGTVTVKNIGTMDYGEKLRIQIWRQAGVGSGTYSTSSFKVVQTDIPAGKSVSIPFTFDNLSLGLNYYVVVSYVGHQTGNIGNGGLWIGEHQFIPQTGVVYWKQDGSVAASTNRAVLATPSTASGIYLNGTSVTRLTPNKNPNTIYYVERGTEVPSGLDDESNLVVDGEAEHICLTDGYAYYVPLNFVAQTATFSHTFPLDADGMAWESFMLPFDAQQILADSVEYSLTDEDKPFALYEFTSVADDGLPLFEPATELRANTPYIIAASAALAGRSIVFTGHEAAFYKSGEVNWVQASDNFNYYGTALQTSLKNVYTLSAEGLAYVRTSAVMLNPMQTYFTTTVDESRLPTEIPLPPVPVLTGISDVHGSMGRNHASTSEVQGGVYDLGGRRLRDGHVLPRGIYVIRGKKVMK